MKTPSKMAYYGLSSLVDDCFLMRAHGVRPDHWFAKNYQKLKLIKIVPDGPVSWTPNIRKHSLPMEMFDGRMIDNSSFLLCSAYARLDGVYRLAVGAPLTCVRKKFLEAIPDGERKKCVAVGNLHWENGDPIQDWNTCVPLHEIDIGHKWIKSFKERCALIKPQLNGLALYGGSFFYSLIVREDVYQEIKKLNPVKLEAHKLL